MALLIRLHRCPRVFSIFPRRRRRRRSLYNDNINNNNNNNNVIVLTVGYRNGYVF